MNRPTIALSFAALSGMIAAACGGGNTPAGTPPNGSASASASLGYPPPNNGYPPPANTGNGSYPPPANTGYPTTPPANNGGGTAQAIDPNVAMLATTALATIASSAAPGMSKEGNTLAGNFTTGQTLSMPFTIAPGKCYTVVAAGIGPGMQVDITATASGPVAIPGFNPQFGQASGKPTATGSQSILGSGNNCIKLALSPIPIQATYVITVSKGSGMVAAQLYSK